MTSTLLYTVARKAEAITPDADLLARFARDRDHPAFEELVRRHGPLVWAVCRHLLPHHADAEDAFQAVFLALVRSASTIRDGRTLPAWLHGVAVRVATRARREFARRRARERRAAVPEADRPVPDAAWESLAAAVHDEVQRLPDAERTAFVLCDLEGVSQADAAARLGWPLGSLSGRLCKARQRLLERLTARGVAPAAAVGIGMTAGAAGAVPANLFDAVKVFPGAPGAASSVAAALARGLTEGVTMRMKLMAATTVAVAALGLTGGALVLSQADAQPDPDGPPGAGAPGGPPGQGGGAGGPGFPGGPGGMGAVGFGAPAVDHKFVDVKSDRRVFEETITKQGKDGWEFCGSERFNQGDLVLVFKKSKAGGFGGAGGVGGPGGGIGAPGKAGRDVALLANWGGRDGVEVRWFTLWNAAAPDAAAALAKAYSKGLKAVVPDAQTNRLLVVADAAVIPDVSKVIADLDVNAARLGASGPGPGGRPAGGLAVIPLKHAVAEDLEAGLKELFPKAEVFVEPRSNQLVVRADAKTVEEIQALVTKLDVEAPKRK